MQGTADHSRLMASPAALRFVEERLGGWERVRAYNSELCAAGARLLVRAWGTRMLPVHSGAQSAPFMAVVQTPLSPRAWVRPALPPDCDEGRLREALDGDSGFNERISLAVLLAHGCQCQFFAWAADGHTFLWVRISAQVYNTFDDFSALAGVLLDLRRSECA